MDIFPIYNWEYFPKADNENTSSQISFYPESLPKTAMYPQTIQATEYSPGSQLRNLVIFYCNKIASQDIDRVTVAHHRHLVSLDLDFVIK
jgi:hypothetical protein